MRQDRKMTILLSSCLLGYPVRYDGKGGGMDEHFTKLLLHHFHVVHICPEVAGGLDTPRVPAEIVTPANSSDNYSPISVLTREGGDVSMQFLLGAERTLDMCVSRNVKAAILKERSPSCGSNTIYDGTFTGTVIPGKGITADLLSENGIKVFSEETIDRFMDWAGLISE